jgi:hypothetical protein
MPGRFEKERAGKHWRPARWEKRDKEYVLVEGNWEDGGGGAAVVVGLGGPTEAPPPLREEKFAPRPGFVYIPGRWDWKDHRWAWMPGRWEKERAGKHWRPARWELRGKEYALVEGDWEDGGAVGVVVGIGPLEPPPKPREEKFAPRPGFVYIPGRWDWRDKKWEWMPGRWEKERAHKKWRPARWELRDKQYALVEGDWVDENESIAAGEPPPGGPPPGGVIIEHRHHWTLDRPTVSSYWPLKGRVGSRIVIHGRNFPPDATVVWSGQPVRGARVTPDEIVVAVPPGAASGELNIRRGGGHDLFVGPFEVKADYDPEAEAKRLEAERLKRAQEEWAARQQALAKDRAAREAALAKYEADRVASREQRRRERIAAIQAKWAKQQFLADPDTQSELTLHAQRVAKLERLKELAEVDNNGKIAIRIDVALNNENDRHDQRMTALEAAFKAKGGAP